MEYLEIWKVVGLYISGVHFQKYSHFSIFFVTLKISSKIFHLLKGRDRRNCPLNTPLGSWPPPRGHGPLQNRMRFAALSMELWYDNGKNYLRSVHLLISNVRVACLGPRAIETLHSTRWPGQEDAFCPYANQPACQVSHYRSLRLAQHTTRCHRAALGSSLRVSTSSLGRFRQSRCRYGCDTRRTGVRSGWFRVVIINRY